MARKSGSARSKRIVDHLAKMLVYYLESHVFPGKKREEISRRTGIGANVLGFPWWADVPEICEGAGVDVGLAIRDHKGHEVIIWPSENFREGSRPWRPAGKKAQSSDSIGLTSPLQPLRRSKASKL